MKKAGFVAIGLVILASAGYLFSKNLIQNDDAPRPTVEVTRGTIVDRVLAIGAIEPENEISIKSKVSGVVARIFAEEGDYVRAGQALLEVRPDPTPLELVEARRAVELEAVAVENLQKEIARQKALADKALISASVYDDYARRYDEAKLRLSIAREKLALLERGRVTIQGTEIESLIRAPIDGYLLTKTIEVGDPVTPLTSFQEGTVLMRMANMDKLVFKGTVDETDVGKLREGMPVELKIGALPDAAVEGKLNKIWLKSEKKENSTVFPVEIAIPKLDHIILRAGYSANAHIIIEKKTDVLMIPERVVTFRNDSTFVQLPRPNNQSEERHIVTGLSDAIHIEVVSGLQEGDRVLEKPVKRIE